ncbi:MAG: proline dehydrogenase family protein, partial [Rhodospirillales bacterium]|nr:proline dehydrogenase family protein [Rhodospirillales bacterium]
MIFTDPLPAADELRRRLRAAHYADETLCVDSLVPQARLSPEPAARVGAVAARLVEQVRRHPPHGLDAFLHEYRLTSQEGVVLMCLAEALLRVPDTETRNRLIRDKIVPADWAGHLGRSDSVLVNASTWALMLTGRLMAGGDEAKGIARRLVAQGGEPVIRQAVTQAMRIMGRQFVMGRTIGEALTRARDGEAKGYRHSFDMLGEAACTEADALRHMESYRQAIQAIGQAAAGRGWREGPGISVKLSALHPRFEYAQRGRVMAELVPRLAELVHLARRHEVGLTVDAEEADRLDLSLDVIEAVALMDSGGGDGFGLAVQAYQKRALPLLDWLADLARRSRRRLAVRLVKGAYWDTEIKRAQERSLPGYPVFTRKVSTDVSYLACARRLL